MKIPEWKDADSNWEIRGGSLDETSSKWFDEVEIRCAREWNSKSSAVKNFTFYSLIDSKTLIPSRSKFHQRVSSRPITRCK